MMSKGRRTRPGHRGWLVMTLATTLLAGFAPRARAQDESQIQRFVNDVGKTLYFFAWPSAKYEGVRFNGLSGAPNGFDARLTLVGKSALDGESLWTELVLEVRNGQVSNVRWGKNNAIAFKPGESISAFGEFIGELNKQYARSNSGVGPAPAAALGLTALCLNNPTKGPVAYRLEWSGKADARTLQPGQAWIYWASQASPAFTIAFDNNFADGYTERRMRLVGTPRNAQPSGCDEVMAYDFQIDDPLVGLAPRRWLPELEHPFVAHLLRSPGEGQWHCAPGFKWVSPEDRDNLECIDARIGLVGVNITIDEGSAYPRVASVFPGSAADKAHLTPGLYLLAIDGVSLESRTLEDVVGRMRGAAGSKIRLGISGNAPDAPPRVLVLTRQ
jgi:hypothetical protein